MSDPVRFCRSWPRCSRPLPAAETYPTRPIRLIVSFPPGGAADIVARLVGQPLSVRLGQPVVVENRPGANGNLAGELVARAAPDGYTLLAGPSGLFAINPHLYAKMAFDPLKELVPIASVQFNTLLLTANPSLRPVKNFRDFIDARPKDQAAAVLRLDRQRQRASSGDGNAEAPGRDRPHPCALPGGGPAALGVIAGDVAAMFGGGSVAPLVQSGKLRGLATSGPRRSALLPDLPTIAEFYPGYEVSLWQGLFAPAGTPPAIIERLRSEVNAVLAQPEYGAKLTAAGSGEPFITTPEEFAARIRSDHEKYGKVIKEIGVAKVTAERRASDSACLSSRLELLIGEFRYVRRLQHDKRLIRGRVAGIASRGQLAIGVAELAHVPGLDRSLQGCERLGQRGIEQVGHRQSFPSRDGLRHLRQRLLELLDLVAGEGPVLRRVRQVRAWRAAVGRTCSSRRPSSD